MAAIVGVIIVGLVLGLVTDTLRLGPSDVALPADAMSVTMEFIRIPDGDYAYDYYYLVVTASNHVSDPSIRPYEADVTMRTNPGTQTMGHLPSVDDREAPFTLSYPDIDRTFTFPAGAVGYSEPTSGTAEWSVRGESLGRSWPIFESHASFLLEIRIDEGRPPSLSSVVTVTWYYHSAVQAYPVASRTITTPTLLIPSGRPST